MKGTRLIALIIMVAMIFSMISCGDTTTDDGTNNPGGTDGGETPDDGNEDDGDTEGDDTNDGEDGESTPVRYVFSVLAKTIHLDTCHYVNEIDELYLKEYVGDIDEVRESDTYSLCEICIDIKVKDPVEEEPENTIPRHEATYVINSKTGKFHVLDCHYGEDIAEHNIKYTDLTIEELLEQEYLACSFCLPEWVDKSETSDTEITE